MNPWKVILATIVIFGAGILTGAVTTRYSTTFNGARHQRSTGGWRMGEFGSPGGMRLEFLRRMSRDLDLSAEQREHIDKLLKQSQERTRKIMEPVTPELHQELQRAKAEFRAALTPAQQIRFDELLKQQQRFKEQRHPGGHLEPAFTNTPATNAIF